MTTPNHTPASVRRLYQIAFTDGCALLALVFIAVPLKYMADFPYLVKILGPLHGVLFITLIVMVAYTVSQQLIKARLAALIVLLAFVPFGAFYADHLLKKHMLDNT